ncbi:DUF2066 domain-containing protein [Luteimonas sp. SX5]|uniref:DUF2066 domain-containing protein n=1 Tax=Luteimonas galliterrae TaxID=2940486 RepID=A0ABT0MK25_9GAMM|nr:DUF2066 domain-containing protein [Luteimonas galliterrae]MCL1635235.1 DUF2066 domain-containing protein [Luteimonas galliterrae]
MHRAIRWAGTTIWLLAGVLALAGTASAQRVEGDRAGAQGVYEAEVPVNSQSESERNAGLARALAQVLGKLSGEGNAAMRPGVGQELRRAKDYVKSYDYRQDEGVSASGAPTFRTTLIARFDQDKVDGMAASLGVPVWPEPRPKPVIWLAIDDGKGPRLVALPQNNVARPLTQRAVERGYRLGLPGGSAAEQAAVGAIWRGDTGAIARLSSRYSPPMQLIGKLYRAKGGWTADWTFVDNGKVLLQKSVDSGDARRALASGADVAGDALSRKYAKRNAVGPAGTYRVAFTGVDSAEDFIRLSAYLQKLPVVRKVTPARATPTAIEYDLELVTGIAGLKRMADEDVLVGGDGEPATFELR